MQLRTLVADSPMQVERVERIDQLLQKKFDELKRTIDLRRTKSFEAARTVVLTDEGKIYMDDMRKVMRDMEAQEQAQLKKRDSENRAKADTTKNTLIFGFLFCVLTMIAAAFVIVRHISQALKEISLVADQIATGALAVQVPHQGRQDEIGVLAKALTKWSPGCVKW